MTTNDLERFATDLKTFAGLDAELELAPKPDGLHVLTINGVDFYFYADGSGYDGWGTAIPPTNPQN
jgi:hypothetical protein